MRRYVERDEAGKDLFIPVWVAHTLTWIDEYGDARRMFDREVARARANGSLGIIPFSLACLAEIDFRVGRWDTCAAGVSEAVRLAEDTAQHTLIAFCVVTLARLEAGRGSAESCRAHVRQCEELAMRFGVGSLRAYATSVSGLLELGLGNIDNAVARLEQGAALVAQQGLREPGVIHWRPDLVEAYALAGRSEDARRTLVALDEDVERTDRLWARAAAERCRGMLDDDFEASFGRALEVHDRLLMPFERARTQLRLGERLRRAKRSGEAREPLREALDVFESLGAAPWAGQARAELAATGGAVWEPRRVGPWRPDAGGTAHRRPRRRGRRPTGKPPQRFFSARRPWATTSARCTASSGSTHARNWRRSSPARHRHPQTCRRLWGSLSE